MTNMEKPLPLIAQFAISIYGLLLGLGAVVVTGVAAVSLIVPEAWEFLGMPLRLRFWVLLYGAAIFLALCYGLWRAGRREEPV